MKTVNREELINGWLKYHDLTVQKLIEIEPQEVLHNGDWLNKYRVTQEQHDEWFEWAKEYIREKTKLPKYKIDKEMAWIDLDIGPSINQP